MVPFIKDGGTCLPAGRPLDKKARILYRYGTLFCRPPLSFIKISIRSKKIFKVVRNSLSLRLNRVWCGFFFVFRRLLAALCIFVKPPGKRRNGTCLKRGLARVCHFAEAPQAYENTQAIGLIKIKKKPVQNSKKMRL